MSAKEIDIADMQCWVFRLAQLRWKISAKECLDIFVENKFFSFIAECYELLHVSSYDAVVSEFEDILKGKNINYGTA